MTWRNIREPHTTVFIIAIYKLMLVNCSFTVTVRVGKTGDLENYLISIHFTISANQLNDLLKPIKPLQKLLIRN